MKFLELKIPPAIVFLISGAAVWAVSNFIPSLNKSLLWTDWLSGFFAVAGGAIIVAGLYEFHRAKTTVDPMKPNSASSIVNSGIHHFTRNPIYLGILFILSGFAFKSSNILSPLFLIGFVLYMHRFQIIPEEKALSEKFGDEYVKYKKSVLRWI